MKPTYEELEAKVLDMFGAGYNSAVVHCESVLHQACVAAGIDVKGE